jgi:hypothetical protein
MGTQIRFRLHAYRSQLLPEPQDHWLDRGYQSLKALRLVCSQFNGAFEAQVLSTLIISVTENTLERSLDMLSTFASQKRETSRAVQHARTLKIKCLSPDLGFVPHLVGLSQPVVEMPEPESQELSPRHPSLKRRFATVISSLRRHLK